MYGTDDDHDENAWIYLGNMTIGRRGLKGDKGDAGQGVPSGGTTGQVLAKSSNSNYATQWVNGSLPSGGTQGYALVKNSNTDFDFSWAQIPTTDGLAGDIYDIIYPIGSIYMSVSDSPPKIEGSVRGTWEQITGRYLVGAGGENGYNTMATGGTTSYTVDFSNGKALIGNASGHYGYIYNVPGGGVSGSTAGKMKAKVAENWTSESSQSFLGSQLAGTQSLSVKPPYYAVNIWRRTA